MKTKKPHIKRRTFLWLLGSALVGVFLSIRFLYNPSKRLQFKLEELGFQVDKKELDKFWEAYMDVSKGESKHPFRVLRTYVFEPREANICLFLLSSNALDKKEGEPIQFIALYSAYSRPCFHPFLEKG